MSEEERAASNTDKELWREADDYYAASIHVTKSGGIGINVGGSVIVKPLQEWHRLAFQRPADAGDVARVYEKAAKIVENEIHQYENPEIAGHMADLACRIRAAASASLSPNREDVLLEALDQIRRKAFALRKGTDDWFDLAEIEAYAANALAAFPSQPVGEPLDHAMSRWEAETGLGGYPDAGLANRSQPTEGQG